MNSPAIALYKALHRKRPYTRLYWDVANEIGIYEAILIEVVERWCEKNEESNKHNYYHNNEWWTSASYKRWEEMYPALGSARKIQRNFLKLTKENYIISCQPSLKKGNPTKYYRVNAEAIGTILLGGLVPNLDELSAKSEQRLVPNLDELSAKSEQRLVPNLDELHIDQINRSDHLTAPPEPGAPPPNSVCVSSSSKKEESSESEKPESTQVSPYASESKQTSPLTTAVSDEIRDSANLENDSHVQDEHPAAESERWLNGGYKQPEWAVKRCGSKWIALPEFIKWYAKSRGKNIEFAANCLQKAESESITQLLWEEYQASLRPSKPLVAASVTTSKKLSPEEESRQEHERRLKLLRSLANFPEGMRQRRFVPSFLSDPSFKTQIDQSEIPEWVKELMEF